MEELIPHHGKSFTTFPPLIKKRRKNKKGNTKIKKSLRESTNITRLVLPSRADSLFAGGWWAGVVLRGVGGER